MAEEGKGIALTILGIVAVIAIVGLVLLFTGAGSGGVSIQEGKVYGGPVQERLGLPVVESRQLSGGPRTEETTYGLRPGSLETTSSIQAYRERDVKEKKGLTESFTIKTCQGLVYVGELPEGYIYDASQQQYNSQYGPGNCRTNTFSGWDVYQVTGNVACCKSAGFQTV